MSYKLEAKQREHSRTSLNKVRQQNLLPAILYGFGVENTTIILHPVEFSKIHAQAGENQIVDLLVDGKQSVSVLIKEVQMNPVRGEAIHADFQAIDTTQPMEVEVPIHYIGESPAVKVGGGSLVKNYDTIGLKAFPKDFLKFVEVSIESLKEIGDVLQVSDVKLGEQYEILNDAQEVLATVVAQYIEKEPEPVVAAETPGEAKQEGEGATAAEAKPAEADKKTAEKKSSDKKS